MDGQIRNYSISFPSKVEETKFYTEIRFCKKGVGQVIRVVEALKTGAKKIANDGVNSLVSQFSSKSSTGENTANSEDQNTTGLPGEAFSTTLSNAEKKTEEFFSKNAQPEIDKNVMDDTKDTGNDIRIAVDNVYLSKNIVYLPLPSKFPEEQFTIDWEEEKLGIFGQMYNNTAYRGSPEVLNTVAAQVMDAAKNKIADIEVFGKQLEGLIKGISHNSGFAFGSDDTILILKSIQRRTISLSWKLVARNAAEDQQIRDVIHMFNYNAIPDNISTFGLAYPASLIIKFITKDKKHMKLQPCRITGIRKDFPETSDGLWRQDGAPVTYDFTVDLKEEFTFYLNHYIKYYMQNKKLI